MMTFQHKHTMCTTYLESPKLTYRDKVNEVNKMKKISGASAVVNDAREAVFPHVLPIMSVKRCSGYFHSYC